GANVAADDAVHAPTAGCGGYGSLIAADALNCVLHLTFQVARPRPVGLAEDTAAAVEASVEEQGQRVGAVAQDGEPFGVAHDGIELVAMNHEQAAPVRCLVDRLAENADAAQFGAEIAAQQLVMVAGDVDDARAAKRLAQQFLYHLMVRSIPPGAAPQPPAVDDVADQIEMIALGVAEKVEQKSGLAAARTEVDIGYPDRPIADFASHHSTPWNVIEGLSAV